MPRRKPVPLDQRIKRLRGRAGVAQRRRRMKRSNGLCEHCLAKGITRAAVIVNHIIRLEHGGSDLDENTENLCKPCDDRVTAEQVGRIDPAKRGVDLKGRPADEGHAWNMARRGK